MEHYVVIKKVTIKANGKVYHENQIITAEEAGEKNIARLLGKKYIRPLGDNHAEILPEKKAPQAELPFYITAEDYLLPEQVNKLVKAQLVEYAGHIGVSGFKPNASAADLKKLINDFIEEATEDEDEESGSGDNENEDNNENANNESGQIS